MVPILQRELRQAARQQSTYRVRWWATVVALLMSGVPFLFFSLTRGPGGTGNALFGVSTSYAFGLCLLSGVLLTAPCLSEEKRDGTLGLLFLAGLRGWDVVLGKFMARSLNALYGLLALLPIIALPLLLGGVTGGEVGRMGLALVNALFFSLAAGLCVSACTSDSVRAARNTFALLFFMAAALPLIARICTTAGVAMAAAWLTWVSPFFPFWYAREDRCLANPGMFTLTLAGSHLLGWLLLGAAGFVLSRTWQGQAAEAEPAGFRRRWARGVSAKRAFRPRNTQHAIQGCRWGRGAPAKRAALRARLLAKNPVLWLMDHDTALRGLAWLLVLGWTGTVCVVSWQGGQLTDLLYPAKGFGFVLKMLVAVQACRFFVDARRNGSLELLLCTPLRNADILKGQWLAMRRTFLWPIIAAVGVSLAPFAALVISALRQPALDRFVVLLMGSVGTVGVLAWFTLGLLADFVAVTWVGMWLALSARKPALAPAMTIFFVLVLPSIGVCGLDLAVDLFLVLWSVSRLQEDFRRVVAARPS